MKGECDKLVLILHLVGMSVHPLGFDLASVGVFISLSLGSAVSMHWMDCFPQKSNLVTLKQSVTPCEVSVSLGAEWADVWGGPKGSSTARLTPETPLEGNNGGTH